MGNVFLVYYLICIVYCFFQLIRTYRRIGSPDALNIAPGLDSIMVLMLGWVLAPVDLILRWITMYKAAEEARRRSRDKQVF